MPRIAWRRELLTFVGAYVLYNAARFVFSSDPQAAMVNADWIMRLERSTGTAVEAPIQHAFDATAPAWALANVYLLAQLVVLPLTLIAVYVRSPSVYRTLRNTVVATWMLSVPIFAAFPVAPPRLASAGLTDTVSAEAVIALTGRSTMFYNQFAAVPSLHVGFAFALGIAVAATLRTRRAKLVAVLWGPLVTLSVLVTANHYSFDVAAGLVVTAAGFGVARLCGRRRPSRSRGREPRAPATTRVATRE